MSEATPRISVVVPCFNAMVFIGRCIRSLLAQTLKRHEYEIIIIDDGSTDDTLDVITPHRENLNLIRHRTNMGLPSALNSGLRAAKGSFVVRVDADDYVHPDYLRVLFLALQLNNELDAVFCDYILVDETSNNRRVVDAASEPIGCGIMFRIEQLIEIGLYNPEFLWCEEEELRKRFEEKYSTHRIPIPLYRYHIHGKNMSLDRESVKHFRSLIEGK